MGAISGVVVAQHRTNISSNKRARRARTNIAQSVVPLESAFVVSGFLSCLRCALQHSQIFRLPNVLKLPRVTDDNITRFTLA